MSLKKLTDAQGNPVRLVFANPTDAQVKSAVMRGIASGDIVLPTTGTSGTLSHASLSDAWIANAETAYANVLAQMKLYANDAIPFFIQTDLHGRSNDPARWLNNKDQRVKNLNLGDNVVDYFSESAGETYRNSALPVQNLITVFGNHEAYTLSAEDATEYGLKYYYTDTTTAGKRMVNGRNFFVSYDDDYNVKYVAVCPYYTNSDGTRDGAKIRTDQMQWLLKELNADDGYDVVLLMHQLWTDTYIHRDGTAQDWQDAPVILEDMWTVLKDRKNKRSGTITDSSGVTHNYDFSDCKTKLLCSLHGHAHEELYLSEESMVGYAADWYGRDNRCTFGLIDRVNNKVIFWVFDNNGCLDPLELSI